MQTSQDFIATTAVVIDAPKAAVWKALVTPAAIKQYMFGTDARSDFKKGSPITWEGEWQGKPYKDKGVIQRVEPERVMQYTHFSPLSGQPDRPENYHTVTIELSDAGGQTMSVASLQSTVRERLASQVKSDVHHRARWRPRCRSTIV